MSQSNSIRVSVLDPSSDVATVRVDGIVDTITCKEVERAIEGLIQRNRHRIVMDLAGVDYISSAGWGVFISHLKEAREHSGDLRLSGMIPNVLEVFELLEFDTILNSFDSASLAEQSFQRELAKLEGGPRAPKETASGGLDELAAIGVDAPSTELDAQAIPSTKSNSRTKESHSQLSGAKPSSLAEALEGLVVGDPFASISELSSEMCAMLQRGKLSRSDEAQTSVGWWWVFRALWRRGLLTRRSRFKLARRESHN